MNRVTGPLQSFELLEEILDLLDEREVPSLVCGAAALACYGLPRASKDADAVISLGITGSSPEAEANALRQHGYDVRVRPGDTDDPISCVITATDRHDNRVDLLVGLRGFDFAGASQRARIAKLSDRTIRLVPPEDFIGMKLFAGSFQDLSDAEAILENCDELDNDLLDRVVKAFGDLEFELLRRLQAKQGK